MKVTKAQSHIGATEAKSVEVFLPDSLALNNLEICLLALCCVQYIPEVGLGTFVPSHLDHQAAAGSKRLLF